MKEMYTSFFKFTENPFSLTPDPRYLFLSPRHRETLEYLLYGIKERKGLIVLTGGIGTGKTTLSRALLNHLDPGTKSALIFNSFISDVELLKTVNQEFNTGMSPGSETKKDYIDTLNQFLIETSEKRGNAILLIDEAQNLSHQVLEQIRMLSNLETIREKLIQIILVGQPELEEMLASPFMKQLNERIMVRLTLEPLKYKDIRGYVEHRMAVAGGQGKPRFTNGAFRQIYAYSRGNPRRINSVCDRALLIAFAKEMHTVSKGIIKKAVDELRWDLSIRTGVTRRLWIKYAAYALILILLIAVGGLGVWSHREGPLRVSSGPKDKTIVLKRKHQQAKIVPQKQPASLFMDEKTSLALLFSLYYNNKTGDGVITEERRLSLVKYDLDPEHHLMLRKPFRVLLSGSAGDPRYFLISENGEHGAVAVDADGEKRKVDENFIMSNWGRTVSWIYPPEKKDPILRKGMNVPGVQDLQETLNKIGYMVEPTGIYDRATFQGVTRFQKEFGLVADGIAGPRTRALLYQMKK